MQKEYFDIRPPRQLQARVCLPASKSISNRALIINALSRSAVMPENVSDCDDTRVMLAALRDRPEVIDIGAAGTAMRFLTAYLSVTPGTHTITGTERMRHRPIAILVDALRRLGADIRYEGEEGFPPLRITGNPHLQGGELTLPGNVSSQYISALLMIAPTLTRGLRMVLTGDIVSRPYLNMTVSLMREFGVEAEWESEQVLCVAPQTYRPRPYIIENDWSAAGYWYEMVALSRDPQAEVVLPGLHAESLQGDRQVSRLFAELGVTTEFFREADGTECVRLRKGGKVTGLFRDDFTRVPDLAQTLAVACAILEVPFEMHGLQTLRIKETDRISAIRTELRKWGYEIETTDEMMAWRGTCGRSDAAGDPGIATYEDHRMAMAFAPACLRRGEVRIYSPGVVSKSYPTYWDDLRDAGFEVCS